MGTSCLMKIEDQRKNVINMHNYLVNKRYNVYSFQIKIRQNIAKWYR